MAEMSTKQRHWFAGVLDTTLEIKVLKVKGPTKYFIQMQVLVGPVSESVAARMVDFLGNGWLERGEYFELRGYDACRGLFMEVWGDITSDTRKKINESIKAHKYLKSISS